MYKVISIGSHAACHLLLHVFAKFISNACKRSKAHTHTHTHIFKLWCNIIYIHI